MRSIWLVVALFSVSVLGSAQCINTFPYTQDFEATNGGWISGGTGDDWAWGAVSKTVIAQAASGGNCWVTGGLTNSFYNLGERSYVQSPCFDFTTVLHPYVSFNVYWETENTYDGATFQYSLDGGTNWMNAGGSSDTSDCLDMNWYNNSNITNLSGLASPRDGWAGNVQSTSGSCQGGGGSAGWKKAQHCMPYLAGKSNVLFRFAFGAGTQCNNFDGFAFDDFTTGEAPAAAISFSYACTGNNIAFSGTTSQCLTNFTWNFGDGSTGSGLFTTHAYATAGSYTVTLNAANKCGVPATITQQVQMLSATATGVDILCNGASTGKAFVTPSGASGYTYTWSTTPAQTTDTAFNLPAGTYTVLVQALNYCDISASVTINEPAAITNSQLITADTCLASVGSITNTVSGGTAPYQYNWSNTATGNPLGGLAQGTYTVTVTDANNCTATAQAVVPYVSGIVLSSSAENVSCYDTNNGKATVNAAGGAPPYTYLWSNNANTAAIKGLTVATYYVTVTDAGNCSNTDSVIIAQDVCPSYIYFPTGFSPNADGVNDLFKATASIDLKKYALQVYNRWGELVFATTDVTEGWNGRYKDVEQPLSTYVWFAEYTFIDGKKRTQSGNVTLVR